MSKRFKKLRYTSSKLFYYWILGALMLWLPLPLVLTDILIDPKWHLPHWQCDSIAIYIFQTQAALLPWALVSIIVSAILVFPFGRGKSRGIDIFKFELGSKVWNWIVSIPVALICVFLLYEVTSHIWEVIVPQTITADCGGRAGEITLVRRKPPVQFIPLLCLVSVLGLLHLRALTLSPKLKNSRPNS